VYFKNENYIGKFDYIKTTHNTGYSLQLAILHDSFSGVAFTPNIYYIIHIYLFSYDRMQHNAFWRFNL
jgi:hypothetical protein